MIPMQTAAIVICFCLSDNGLSEPTRVAATNKSDDAAAAEKHLEKRPSILSKLFRHDPTKRKTSDSESSGLRAALDRLRKRPETPSDWMLLSRCRNILRGDRDLADAGIQVDAKNGTVYLRGAVASSRMRDRAEQLARQTEGALGVRNFLIVASAGPAYAGDSAVQLAYPRSNDGHWRASHDPSMPIPSRKDALRSRPLPSVSPSENQSATSAPAASLDVRESSRLGVDQNVGLESLPAIESLPGAVILGKPQVLDGHPGLPAVVTYVIQRPVQPESRLIVPAMPTNGEIERMRYDRKSTIAETPFLALAHRGESARFVTPAMNPLVGNGAGWIAGAAGTHPAANSAAPRRSEINAIVARHDQRLRWTIDGNDVVLSGAVASRESIERVFTELARIPGVGALSYEDLRFDR